MTFIGLAYVDGRAARGGEGPESGGNLAHANKADQARHLELWIIRLLALTVRVLWKKHRLHLAGFVH